VILSLVLVVCQGCTFTGIGGPAWSTPASWSGCGGLIPQLGNSVFLTGGVNSVVDAGFPVMGISVFHQDSSTITYSTPSGSWANYNSSIGTSPTVACTVVPIAAIVLTIAGNVTTFSGCTITAASNSQITGSLSLTSASTLIIASGSTMTASSALIDGGVGFNIIASAGQIIATAPLTIGIGIAGSGTITANSSVTFNTTASNANQITMSASGASLVFASSALFSGTVSLTQGTATVTHSSNVFSGFLSIVGLGTIFQVNSNVDVTFNGPVSVNGTFTILDGTSVLIGTESLVIISPHLILEHTEVF
jgi:hypothetical protein